ncbi:hypothetical protein PsalMR5_02008 [Piscirickettsia salmonis]|uniref:hypothetical protein n=1 Tax=Piscirickettsia salmonis TaxID=1238 RepID=UPI0012BA80C7|nr:hypothetical protein [Piscirickettsia salmonis]QGP54660.1 hypothetical protein PsalSR1_02101 [Piscirickettsia salmonis]QGP59443.1 hypothetical protein PsalBI1_02031 [Piscirickettsia salmonis]QGP64143.1 hypothetical protein PsalMR5_02008 [Piscirickettsia salmonis]
MKFLNLKDSFDATFWYSALFTVINIILVYLTFSSEKKRIKAAKTPSLLSSFKAYSPLAVTMLILVFLCQLAWSSYYQNINYTVISIWHLSISSNLYQQLMLIIGLSMIL